MCRKHLKWLHNCYNDKNNRNNNKKKCTQNKKVAKVLTKSLANKSSLKSFRKLYQICLGYKIPCNSNDEILRHTYIRKGIFSAQPNIYDGDNQNNHFSKNLPLEYASDNIGASLYTSQLPKEAKNKKDKQQTFKCSDLTFAEAVVRRCFSKQVLLKISQISKENTCAGASF